MKRIKSNLVHIITIRSTIAKSEDKPLLIVSIEWSYATLYKQETHGPYGAISCLNYYMYIRSALFGPVIIHIKFYKNLMKNVVRVLHEMQTESKQTSFIL